MSDPTQDVAARIERGKPVTGPGVPRNYPDLEQLVTEDCITPPGEEKPHQPDGSTAQSYGAAAHYYAAKEEPKPYGTK